MSIQNLMNKIIILSVFFLFSTHTVFASETGFLSSQVELSPSIVNENDEVEISISFSNQENQLLTGKISFYDKNILLGSRELSLEPNQTGEFIIMWTASLGDHSFTAKAENLKLAGSSVTILGPSTDPKKVMIGFKNSSVAEKLRAQGGFGMIAADVVDEVREFFIPIINSLDEWRISRITPLEITKDRLQREKDEIEDGKIKPILTIHFLATLLLLFIVSKKGVFFTLVSLCIIFGIVKLIKLFKRIVKGDYSHK